MKSFTVLFALLLLTIFYLPSSVSAAATMNDYWQGKAEWKLVNKLTIGNTGWDYGYGAGAHINIVGNNWYLFGRKVAGAQGSCPYGIPAGTEVRKSTDGGLTWSAPVDIIVPHQPGTAWECGGTDGDAYYNDAENKWHYLFQCMSTNGVWNGCHVEKSGADPMGLFLQNQANPTITAKSLWGKICTNPNADCVKLPGGVNRVFDEGTFNIFDYRNGNYFVSFHGVDGTYSYRGIAKTPDFINWIAGDTSQGVPADAVLDRNDALNFRESWQGAGPIGFGAGSILYDEGYYYLTAEAPDFSLMCIDGQNWDWGIFRSNSLTNTNWEQFPSGNPILYSSKKPERNNKSMACNPAYTRIFKDPGTNKIYLHTTRDSLNSDYNGIFLYELIPSNNLLQNGDLWKCNSDDWQRISGGNTTNMITYRYPNESSDGNCFLSFNCGANVCNPGQSIYQDADVSNIPYRNIAYGGKFATEAGTGDLLLDLFEFDQAGNIVNENKTNLTVSTNYQSSYNQIALKDATKKVRFQVYLSSNNNFKADEMFVEPIAQFFSPTPEPSIPPPLPKKETCSVSAPPTANAGQPFNINFSALADDTTPRTENLWLERADGQPINPAPAGTLVQGGNVSYYRLTTCNSSISSCSGSATIQLPSGSYITHCDSNGKNKCSGNPFCDYNGGSIDCSSTGWRDCASDDSQAINIGGPTPAPQVISVVFNGGANPQTAQSLDLSGINSAFVKLTNGSGNNYTASVDVTVSTGGIEATRHLTIKFNYQPPVTPTSFEMGMEAGEQHDTSRVSLVKESGARWVRLNFVGNDWTAGSNDVNTYNSIINAYRGNNIKIIGLIGAQSVSGGYDRNNPGSFTQKFTDVADAIIARFGDRVKVFELFNEPNDWAGGNTSQVTERYFAEYLASVYRKIKIDGGRSDISLNSGPLFSFDLNNGASYLQETFNQGKSLPGMLNWGTIKNQIGSYPLDGIGYHIYVSQGMGDQNQVVSKLLENLDAMNAVINSNDPGKQIWITEMGWGTGPDRVTEEVQAANLEKAYQLLVSRPGVRLGMWFTLMDFDSNEWGLVRTDGTKKLAWYKFQQLANINNPTPTPTPTPSPSSSPAPSPSASVIPTPSGSFSPYPSVSPNHSPTPGPSATVLPGVSPSPTPNPTSTPVESNSPISEDNPTPVPSPSMEIRTILLASQPIDPSGQSPLFIRLTGQAGKSSSVLVPVSFTYTQDGTRNMSIQFNYTGQSPGQGGSVNNILADKKYDLNGDRVINSVDVILFFNGWRSKLRGGSIVLEDFNVDGVINSIDYAMLKNQIGKKLQ